MLNQATAAAAFCRESALSVLGVPARLHARYGGSSNVRSA